MIDLPYPNINGESNEKKLAQINAYLIQLKDALEFALMGMSSENQSVSEALAKGLSNSNVEREDQLTQVSSKMTSEADNTKSAIEQTADRIMLEVAKKIGANEVVAIINVSPEEIELKGNRIIIESENFELTKEGKVIAKSLDITGGSIHISSLIERSNPITLKDVRGRMVEIDPYNIEFNDGTDYAEIGAGFVSVGTKSGDTKNTNANIYPDGSASFLGVYNSTTTDAPNVHVWANGLLRRSTSSSERYKKDITEELSDALNPQKLYSLPVKSYKYKDDYLSENDKRYQKDIIGFIAEDVAEIYECAVQYNEKGQPEMWNSNVMIPALLKLIQEQNERIKVLEEKIQGE